MEMVFFPIIVSVNYNWNFFSFFFSFFLKTLVVENFVPTQKLTELHKEAHVPVT